MKLRQLFCRHKQSNIKKRVVTERKREATGQTVLGLPIYCNYLYCDEYMECLSCGKEYILKKKYISDVSSSSVLY